MRLRPEKNRQFVPSLVTGSGTLLPPDGLPVKGDTGIVTNPKHLQTRLVPSGRINAMFVSSRACQTRSIPDPASSANSARSTHLAKPIGDAHSNRRRRTPKGLLSAHERTSPQSVLHSATNGDRGFQNPVRASRNDFLRLPPYFAEIRQDSKS